jgi:hypothetical protein
MDSVRFDRLAKGLAGASASRRLVTRGIFATAAASIPLVGHDLDALGRRRKKHRKKRGKKQKHWQEPLTCSGDSCDGTGGKPCGGRNDCQCYRYAAGGNVCASSLQSSLDQTCTTDHDCPHGSVCVEGGPACGGRDIRFCKQACYA